MTDEMLLKRRDDACNSLVYWLDDLTRIVRDPSGEWVLNSGLPDVMLGGTVAEQCEAAMDRRLVRHIGLDELLRLNRGRAPAKREKCGRCLAFGGQSWRGDVSYCGDLRRCDKCGTLYRLDRLDRGQWVEVEGAPGDWVQVDSLEAVKP